MFENCLSALTTLTHSTLVYFGKIKNNEKSNLIRMFEKCLPTLTTLTHRVGAVVDYAGMR